MSSRDMITIGEILEMRAGDRQKAAYINDDFECLIQRSQRGRTDKSPDTAELCDPHNTAVYIVGSFFGRDISKFEGAVVHISGKGVTRTEYNGKDQVTIGDKANVQLVGRGQGGNMGQQEDRREERRDDRRDDRRRDPEPRRDERPPAGPRIVPINGQTVGMAINQANGLIKETLGEMPPADRMDYFKSTEYSRDLGILASDIIRVSAALEKGKLAESPAKREAGSKPAEQERQPEPERQPDRQPANERPKPGADGSSVSLNGIDEDVPF